MNIRDFVYCLLTHGKQLVSHHPHTEFRPEVAVLSSLMDFPCDFDEQSTFPDGKCAAKRHSPKCCCINCSFSVGHFGNKWPNDLYTLKRYAKRFTAKNGFWRPDKGCILPRHMRSLTCAFYLCYEIRDEFNKRNNKELCQLRVVVREYTDCSYRYGKREGTQHKEIKKSEEKLTETVNQIMIKEKLYFDTSKMKLVNVAKREERPDGWVTLHLADDNRQIDIMSK